MEPEAPMLRAGLIGYPVKHSLSPVIHNTALRSLGINGSYEAMEVPPDLLEPFIKERLQGFVGTNVTIPHKQAVIPYLDVLSPVARAIGAVNTVVVRANAEGMITLYGDNTDVAGFLAPFEGLDPAVLERIRRGRVVILGSGGAARAVAHAVREFRPTRVTVVARNRSKARRLVKELRRSEVIVQNFATSSILDFGVLAFDSDRLAESVAGADLIVNATPVGLSPQVGETPLPGVEFVGGQVVYDLIYRPRETRLLSDARDAGAVVIDGTEMLIAQAAASFVQWFGREMPIELVRAALDKALDDEAG